MAIAITKELQQAVDEARTEEYGRDLHAPLQHLTWEFQTLGVALIKDATYVDAYAVHGRHSEYRMEDLRNAALRVGRVLSAYDAAVAAGTTLISNADWKNLRDRGVQ